MDDSKRSEKVVLLFCGESKGRSEAGLLKAREGEESVVASGGLRCQVRGRPAVQDFHEFVPALFSSQTHSKDH